MELIHCLIGALTHWGKDDWVKGEEENPNCGGCELVKIMELPNCGIEGRMNRVKGGWMKDDWVKGEGR